MTFQRLKIQFSFQNQFVEIENEYFSQSCICHDYSRHPDASPASDEEPLVWCPSIDWRNLHWDWDWEPQPVTVSPQVWPHIWRQGGVLVGVWQKNRKIWQFILHGNICNWTTIITQSLSFWLIIVHEKNEHKSAAALLLSMSLGRRDSFQDGVADRQHMLTKSKTCARSKSCCVIL